MQRSKFFTLAEAFRRKENLSIKDGILLDRFAAYLVERRRAAMDDIKEFEEMKELRDPVKL